MSDAQEKVYIKLIDAGNRQQAVLSVLAKIQGLKDAPEKLLTQTPCRISEKVSRGLADKVKDYLEKAGARVELEVESVSHDDEEAYLEFDTPGDAVKALEGLHSAYPKASSETQHLEDVDVLDTTPATPPSKPSLQQALTDIERHDASRAGREQPHSRQPEPVPPVEEQPEARPRPQKKRRASFALLPLGVMAALLLLGLGALLFFAGYFPGLSKRYEQNPFIGQVGVLTIENPAAADLSLFHVIGTRVIKQIPLSGEKILLKLGDYYLEARKDNKVVRFPVYIKGRGHRLAVTVAFPERKPFSEKVAVIPAGWFRIGNKETEIAHFGFPDETPDVDVYVDEIAFSKYEVTNREFAEFVRAGGYNKEAYWERLILDWPSLVEQVPAYGNFYGNDGWKSARKYIRAEFVDTDNRPAPRLWETDEPPYEYGQDNMPVVGITLYEADAYCKWFGEQIGRPVRLPTEAEWEKAAKGFEGYVFSYGNEYDPQRANTENEGPRKVGSYPPNSYGLYDMTGNAWEWVTDQYRADAYQLWQKSGHGGIKNPRVFDEAKRYDRVAVRGGSFRSVNRINARTPVRYPMFPNYWHTNIGFRYVVAP